MVEWGIVVLALVVVVALATYVWQYRQTHPMSRSEIDREVQRAREHSRATTKATNAGLEAEQLAAWIEGFPYSPRDAQFFGKPIDFVIFDGLMSRSTLERIIFVEVKSSERPNLTNNQKQVRDAVEDGRVEFATVNITRRQGESKPQVKLLARRRPFDVRNTLPLPSAESEQ